jgi:hypothetical protein
MNLFSEVAALLTRREQKKTEDFDSLVKAVADGGRKGPTVSQIAERLESLGCTAADLEAAVSRRLQRQEFVAALATIPELQAEKAELERKGREETLRFEALVKPLQEEHKANLDGLNSRYFFVTRQIPAAEGARQKLISSYRGPLEQELVENRIRKAELERAIELATRRAAEAERVASCTRRDESADQIQVVREAGQVVGYVSGTERWAKADSKDTPCLPPDELATALASAQSCRADVTRMQQELAALVKREAEILELMLVP